MKEDRRVQKTKDSLFDALGILMEKKKYNRITIQDIIDEANIGRSTFYTHFETKDDLLFARSEQYLGFLNNYIYHVIERSDNEKELLSIQDLFEHIEDNKKAIGTLFKNEGSEMFTQKAVKYWQDAIIGYLNRKYPTGFINDVPNLLVSYHISNTLIHLLELWVNGHTNYTPTEMNLYFQRLINPLLT